MKFTIHVNDHKAPFFLELIQQLPFVKIEKIESEEMEDLQKVTSGFGTKKNSSPSTDSQEVTNLQNEIDAFFGN